MTARPPRRHAPPGEPVIPPAPSTIDLHTHTSRSDGLLSTVAARAPRPRPPASGSSRSPITTRSPAFATSSPRSNVPAGLDLLPGIEINAITADRLDLRESEVHVLGLGVDPDDDELEATLALQRRRRAASVRADGPRPAGHRPRPIDDALEALPGDRRRRCARAAAGRPGADREGLRGERRGGLRASTCRAAARPTSRARASGPIEAIRAIRAAGGLASLAHFSEAPASGSTSSTSCGTPASVDSRSTTGPSTRSRSRPSGESRPRPRLVATGGSDYHGDLEIVCRHPRRAVGAAHGRGAAPGGPRRRPDAGTAPSR